MIPLLQTKTGDTAHTGIFASDLGGYYDSNAEQSFIAEPSLTS